ncbi:subtilisin family serine protease [Solirubrobacter pauli]|uniref:Subtilisin family serine protease n=1 Tax=Solirubrobacter pauli TaxID=166793 RepID=A0A660LGZ5_9ACTN|nr:subtilisin family serine protease [Solirubrobacter pauli]
MVLFCALGCLLPPMAAAGDIIVRRDAGLTAAERADVRTDAGVQLERMLDAPDLEVVSAPAGQEAAAVARLEADADVRFAVPDITLHTASTPGLGWPLDWENDADVDAPKAWETPWRGQDVMIGVVDQRVDATHPKLAGHVEPYDPAYDFVVDGCTAGPPTGGRDHGTHVAGIIVAAQDGVLMAGLAPQAQVRSYRAMDNCGAGKLSWVLDAFTKAGQDELPIVSASFSTDPLLPASEKVGVDKLVSDVVDRFPGTLYVVAAGNEGANLDEPGKNNAVYPCSNDAKNILCVGMTGGLPAGMTGPVNSPSDAPVCWGNVGRTSVDVFAPGLAVYSTVRAANGVPTHALLSGTSQATPLVAAAAALLQSVDSLTHDAETLKDTLLNAVDRLDTLEPISSSGGRLNAARALFPRPPDLGPNGPTADWSSCDTDHDGVRGAGDLCPTLAGTGTVNGCPDRDKDGVIDPQDNCPDVANPDQADQDGDGIGDACDADRDGDGKVPPTDGCPTVFASTPNGCPLVPTPTSTPSVTPTPTPPKDDGNRNPAPAPTPDADPSPASVPKVTMLEVKVTPKSCKGRKACKQAAKVTVKVSRSATVAVRIERKVGRKWRQIDYKSLRASMRGKSVTIRGARGKTLTRGSYRVIATISGSTTQRSFKV